jgi:hypothetical protein
MLLIFAMEKLYGASFGAVNESDSAIMRLLIPNAVYIVLGVVAVTSAIIAYRLVAAGGATATVVIPPQDYPLLAPLVAEGRADAIDQYVRLSSLAKFTDTFTQLGLTGLPLATIGLTLFFSGLALLRPEEFLDLAKLTLGAFIGSFVQRQVERGPNGAKAGEAPDGEAVTPREAR